MQWWQSLRRAVARHRRVPAVPDPPRPFIPRDRALVAVATLAAVGELLFRPDVVWRPVAFVACLVVIGALPWRRTHPARAMTLAFAPTLVTSLAAYLAVGPAEGMYASVVAVLDIYALFHWGSGRDQQHGEVLLAAAWVIGVTTDPGTLGDAIGGIGAVVVPALLGALVRAQVAARVRRYDDVRLAERESLARELHDTVAHHVSAIVVQAQAGRAIASSRPERVDEVLGAIEQAATDALGEMRALVGALRRDEPEAAVVAAPRQPQPGIGELERLVAQPAGALAVRLELDGDVHALPAGVAAAVYRIVQESITNAARHAVGATEVVVHVAATRDHVEVLVRDDGEVRPGQRRDGGYGLRGMAERVALLGGTFDAGPSGPAPQAQGAGDAAQARGWVVRATVPLARVAGRR